MAPGVQIPSAKKRSIFDRDVNVIERKKVECPVCNQEVPSDLIEMHLDGINGCLAKKTKRTNSVSGRDVLHAVMGKATAPVETKVVECPCCGKSIREDAFSMHFEGKNGCLNRQSGKNASFEIVSRVDLSAETSSSSGTAVKGGDHCFEKYRLVRGSLPGLFIVPDFISAEEETDLMRRLDFDPSSPWHFSSFNGNCMSKTFGFKTHFGKPGEDRLVRRNNPSAGEPDMPSYLEPLLERLRGIVAANAADLKESEIVKRVMDINECNANSYERADHFLRPHFDDRHMSGPFLVNLSMGRSAYMTYSKSADISADGQYQEHDVLLPPRHLQLVTGEARWLWRHEIKQDAFLNDGTRRVSITWRVAGVKGQFPSKADAASCIDSFFTSDGA